MQSFNSLVTIRDYFHLFFLILYFCIPYLGPIGAFDVVGSQWLAISLLNFILLTFFCILKYPVGEIVNNYLFLIIILFMLWAAYSLTYTINFSEGIIVYARLINTFVAAINISLLLKNRTNIINLFAFILIILLIGEGLYVFKCFIINPQKLSLDSLILSIKGNSGNKNIFAAALLFKIPFSIFLYYQKQRRFNYIALLSFFLGVSSVFIMNTRSTYIGLLMIVFFALTFSMYNNKVKSFVILVLTIISFLFSNFLLKSKVENFNQQISNYGTTISRIKTINFSQSGRSEIWLDGLYAIKDNPITGCGIGNWKILSAIKTHGIEMYKSDWLVPYHIHNDFIEMCVELGLIGGILFVFIFVFLFFIFIKNNLITHVLESRLLLLLLLSCFFCYCIDSFLNFPLERPAMQLNFAFLIAMGFLYSPIRVITKFPLRIFFLFFMFLILPTIVIAKKHFDLLVLQNIIMESNSNGGVLPMNVIDHAATRLKPFPNLSSTTIPFDAMIASEYAKINQLDKALFYLERSKNDNPLIGYNDCVKTYVYLKMNRNDSAKYYMQKAWNKRPWASDVYKNALLVSMREKNDKALKKYFTTYLYYRNTPSTFLEYFKAKWNLDEKIEDAEIIRAKSIIAKFPNDPYSLELRNFIKYNQRVKLPSGQLLNYNEIEKKAFNSFVSKNYSKAIEYYTMAYKIDSTQYTHLENIGILYFNLRNLDSAEFYFKKSLLTGKSTNGNSDYFLGLALLEKNRKDEACKYFLNAKNKGNTAAYEKIKINCSN